MKFLAQSMNVPSFKSLDVVLFNDGAAVIELAMHPSDKVGTFRMDVAGLAHICDTSDNLALKFGPDSFKFVAVDPDNEVTPFSREDNVVARWGNPWHDE
ncbi:hypothetical protein HDU87_008175 [Geranomyces variabilis]|uniref:Uncharacterized protein n=1 Tax=Geranomyces variabilis TaxID=109894 RepID=A0AAD5XJ98_9FUNG|nr:hypothetical protein HDU87_008175 [Geranomyces variabilis]